MKLGFLDISESHLASARRQFIYNPPPVRHPSVTLLFRVIRSDTPTAMQSEEEAKLFKRFFLSKKTIRKCK